MTQKLKIVPIALLESFKSKVTFDPLNKLMAKEEEDVSFDKFDFYTSLSSVYSSKIEGESIEVDSYIKHKFAGVQYEPDYTKRADDLFAAYEFANREELTAENVIKAHAILSQNLLAKSHRGRIRTNPMFISTPLNELVVGAMQHTANMTFVLNEQDRIEYVAAAPQIVQEEWGKLFDDIAQLKKANLTSKEAFYYAACIHLIFLKIHPMQDGNGRTARLIEKWFLQEQLGERANVIELEKNYYKNKPAYYDNIRKIGLDYETLGYSKSLDFLLMTIGSL